jgi:hypothetical protein
MAAAPRELANQFFRAWPVPRETGVSRLPPATLQTRPAYIPLQPPEIYPQLRSPLATHITILLQRLLMMSSRPAGRSGRNRIGDRGALFRMESKITAFVSP